MRNIRSLGHSGLQPGLRTRLCFIIRPTPALDARYIPAQELDRVESSESRCFPSPKLSIFSLGHFYFVETNYAVLCWNKPLLRNHACWIAHRQTATKANSATCAKCVRKTDTPALTNAFFPFRTHSVCALFSQLPLPDVTWASLSSRAVPVLSARVEVALAGAPSFRTVVATCNHGLLELPEWKFSSIFWAFLVIRSFGTQLGHDADKRRFLPSYHIGLLTLMADIFSLRWRYVALACTVVGMLPSES